MKTIQVSDEVWKRLKIAALDPPGTMGDVIERLLDLPTGGVPRGGDANGTAVLEMPDRTGSDGPAVVQDVSRGVHAGNAPSAPGVVAGATEASERPSDSERVSTEGKVGAETVRGVRGAGGGETPRRLRAAAGRAVAVSDASPGIDPSAPCRRCGHPASKHLDGGKCIIAMCNCSRLLPALAAAERPE